MGGSMEIGKGAESHVTLPESLLSSAVVVAGPSSAGLATNISKTMCLSMICPEIRVFSDGESKIRIKEKLEDKTCIVIQSHCPPQIDRHIVQTLMILKKCIDDFAKDIIVVVPYVAYARQDRAFLDGEVITIELMAKLYKTFRTRHLVTVDIHSLRALTYFKGKIDTINISAAPLLAHYAKAKLRMSKDDSITVSPDEGGLKRAKSFALELNNNIICMKKIRDRKTGEVFMGYTSSNDRDRIRERDVVLIDDIISTGSTIIKAAGTLKSDGCRDIIAMCTHALITEESSERIKAAGVSKIVTTNSIPKATGTGSFVQAIDLSPILASAISKILTQ
jgi:ribose-phosphate pyrophosphokinase